MPMISNRQSSAGRREDPEIDWSKTPTTKVSVVSTTKVKKEKEKINGGTETGVSSGAPLPTPVCYL